MSIVMGMPGLGYAPILSRLVVRMRQAMSRSLCGSEGDRDRGCNERKGGEASNAKCQPKNNASGQKSKHQVQSYLVIDIPAIAVIYFGWAFSHSSNSAISFSCASISFSAMARALASLPNLSSAFAISRAA